MKTHVRKQSFNSENCFVARWACNHTLWVQSIGVSTLFPIFQVVTTSYLDHEARHDGVIHKWRNGPVPVLQTGISSPITVYTSTVERRCPRSISIKPKGGEAMLSTWRLVESDELNASRMQLVSFHRCTDVTMSGVLRTRRKVMLSPSAFCPRPGVIKHHQSKNQKD